MFVRQLALAIGFLLACIGAQGPEFAQQYRQRLAGAIDELTRVVAQFDADAASHSLTPQDAVKRLETNPDPLARDRGAAADEDARRLMRLEDALAELKGEPSVQRLLTLAKTFDPEVASRTWKDFEPAIPTTTEGFVIGAALGVIGWLSTHLTAWPIRRRLGRRSAMRRKGEVIIEPPVSAAAPLGRPKRAQERGFPIDERPL